MKRIQAFSFRHRLGVTAWLAVLTVIACWLRPGSVPAQDKAGKHALLVGVTNYPHLAERFHLKGPANDVLLMRDLLLKQFAFPKENVTILSEEEGKRDEKNYPTHAAIKREFERLAKVAQAGDQIIILMGGHGSQQPEGDNPVDPEPDGLDEIFLPRDVKEWEGDASKVPNAIIDDEIGAWLKALQAKKAFVWIIFDSCHSGTMIRGVSEQARQVTSEGDLKIPRAAIRIAQEKAAKRSKEGTRGGPALPERAPLPQGGIVAMYACQETEVTVERELPANSKDAKPYGLLTYTIVQILTQAHQNGGRPPTYREILQLTHSRYGAMGRTSPTPQMEGGLEDRNREALGTTSWSGRSSILLSEVADGWKINAGRLHGMKEGSVLAVKPMADQKDANKVIAHVRVEEVKMTTSSVTPCAFGAMKLQKKLPAEARCEVVHVDFGIEKLRLAIDPQDGVGKLLPGDTAALLAKSVNEVVEQAKTMFRKADAIDKADWLVRWHAGKVYLAPASEWSLKIASSKESTLFGPYATDKELVSKLGKTLALIVRAENFKKLVGVTGDVPRGGGVKVDLDLVRFPNPDDLKKQVSLPFDSGKVQVFNKDTIGMTLTNPNKFAIDVTILYIDSGFGIDSYFPDPSKGEINRVKSGETITVPPMKVEADKTFGLENLVVIAIKATTKEPIDFSFMAQPTLEKAVVARSTAMKDATKSPLESLMENSLYGAGTTRAVSRATVDEFTFRIVPWHLAREVRPKGK